MSHSYSLTKGKQSCDKAKQNVTGKSDDCAMKRLGKKTKTNRQENFM